MMKKYEEILKEIEKTHKQKKVVEKKQDNLWEGYFSLEGEEKEARKQLIDEYHLEIEKANKYNADLEIKLQVLEHNAKCILFEEVKPIIIEVLNKYKNKAVGEATNDKIYKEIKERCNCSIHLDRRYEYNHYINITPLTNGYTVYYERGISISIEYKDNDNKVTSRTLFEDNKLKEINEAVLYCRYKESKYIEDITKYIRDYKKAYIKAYKAQEALKKCISEYNNIRVGDLKELTATKAIQERYIYKK